MIGALGALATGCAPAESASESDDLTKLSANWKRDIVSTDLVVDYARDHAMATIHVAESAKTGASFEVEGLDIESVETEAGPVKYRVVDGRLDVALKAHAEAELTIAYGFKERTKQQGAMKQGLAFTWPNYCGNLFPCKSTPSDGLRFGLALENVPKGKQAIYPSDIPADAPPYMLSWAVGDYTQKKLGTTKAGTKVSVYYLPGEQAAATKGTAHLVAAFEFYEKTYGPYTFGSDVGSVSAPWGPNAFGGMEHHPYWHVASDAMNDEETHAHEAAHGWFGDGVRLACWEDLTLSEGTVSYITARALEATAGKAAGDAVWKDYQGRLDAVATKVAWPDMACNTIDVEHVLWTDAVYMKGAFFYRAVEKAIGAPAVDRAIARFYAEHHGKAAGVKDMLGAILAETGFDASSLASAWLRSKSV
ncbi:MAG TPA: M1 family aminopeptidase, partial [Polyangiaceae bacterium]